MFISKTNGMYKRNYSFKMNIMEEIVETRSCIEILANDIKIYTIFSTVNKELQGIHNEESSLFKR